MATENVPTLREVILEEIYFRTVDLVEADAEPLLDETGNYIRDENGNIIYG